MATKNKCSGKTAKKTSEVRKSMSFAEIMKKSPKAIEILLGRGLHCIGCPMAMQETLEQGALMHGLNPDEIVKEINEKLKLGKNKNGG